MLSAADICGGVNSPDMLCQALRFWVRVYGLWVCLAPQYIESVAGSVGQPHNFQMKTVQVVQCVMKLGIFR